MKNSTVTKSRNMSATNALLATPSSLTLRVPRQKGGTTKKDSSFDAQKMALVQRSKTNALNALKRGYDRKYFSKAEFADYKMKLNSETDFSKVGVIWDEILDRNLLGSKLNQLKVELKFKRENKRFRRVSGWARDRNWYTARALIMHKDAVKFGIDNIKQFKENLKNCLTPCGQIHSDNVNMDMLLRYSDELKYKLRIAGHPAYQKGKTRRKYIRNCMFNRYYATPIIP